MSDSSVTDRLINTRKAHASGDVEASRQAHDGSSAAEPHQSGGKYLKSAVYGGMDGIITMFAVVAGTIGGSLTYSVVIILGLSSLVADGVSMGLGDYVSSKADNDFARREQEREMWECENYIEGERAEMVDIYSSKKGISREDAKTIVEIISRDYDTFVDIMMKEELGLIPPEDDEGEWKNGLTTFASFCVLGLVPLLPYGIHLLAKPKDWNVKTGINPTFGASMGATALVLFILGAATTKYSIHSWWRNGMFTLVNGAVAAGIAFGTAYLIAYIGGED